MGESEKPEEATQPTAEGPKEKAAPAEGPKEEAAPTETPKAREAGKRGLSKRDLIVRIVLIIVLVIIAAMALRLRTLRAEYKRALDLYDEREFQEAHDIFETICASPVSIIKVRSKAKQALGRCKAELASEIVLGGERTAESYGEALKLLEEARELTGGSEEIERRIKEYSEYKERIESPDQPAPAAKTPKE